MATDRNLPPKLPRREPWHKLEYENTLRRVLRDDPERSSKFKICELVAAFLTMRRRDAGIDARIYRVEAHAFEIQTLQSLALYIPGKDSVTDGLLEVETLLVGGNIEKAIQINRQLIEHTRKQSEKAKSPRKAGLFNAFIDDLLKVRPNLSEPELIKELEKEFNRGGIVSSIEYNEIEMTLRTTEKPRSGQKTNERCITETVKRSTIRNRLCRRKKLFKN